MRSTQRERWKIRHENQYRRNTLAPSWGLAGDQGHCSLFSVRFESALLSVWPAVAYPLAVAVPPSSGCAVCDSQGHPSHLRRWPALGLEPLTAVGSAFLSLCHQGECPVVLDCGLFHRGNSDGIWFLWESSDLPSHFIVRKLRQMRTGCLNPSAYGQWGVGLDHGTDSVTAVHADG